MIAIGFPAAAATIEGRVVAVADGDTITILDDAKVQHRVRIHGIDAPEKGQAFGQRAKENMSQLGFGKDVKAECHKKDRYQRQVCVIWVRPPDCLDCGLTFDAGLAQITQGLAWHFKAYEKEQSEEDRSRYADAELKARARRAGLWVENAPVAPWAWRASRFAAKPKAILHAFHLPLSGGGYFSERPVADAGTLRRDAAHIPTWNAMVAIESKLSLLRLVYPPMSNQEAVWLSNDKDVEGMLRRSDFYIIGGRAEAKFLHLTVDPKIGLVTFDFTVGECFSDSVSILIRELPAAASTPEIDLEIEAGEKIVRVWRIDDKKVRTELLEWFTTEKLLFDKSRGRPGISGFERYRDVYMYDLLYVGIAKVGDSYDRLIAKGHKARTDILANEQQRMPAARVTDETFLFLFKVEPIYIKTFDLEHDFDDEEFDVAVGAKRVVADAEKAFIRLLDPKYNTIKYQSYPKGSDGLYGSQLVRYGYTIGENITFNTPKASFKGGWDADLEFVSNEGDCILVEGDQVSLFLSGVHYGLEEDQTTNARGG